MTNEKANKIVKTMSIIWGVVFAIYAVIARVYISYVTLSGGASPLAPFSGYFVVTLLVTLCFFFPLIVAIHHFAVKAGLKIPIIISRILIALLTVWMIGSFVAMIYAGLST